MARLNSADELEALRRQQIELAKRIKEVELKTRQKEKVDNERREQIAGRAVLAHLASHPHSDVSKAIVGILESSIVKPAERSLFFGAAATPSAAAAPQDIRRPEHRVPEHKVPEYKAPEYKRPEERAPEPREPFAAPLVESGGSDGY